MSLHPMRFHARIRYSHGLSSYCAPKRLFQFDHMQLWFDPTKVNREGQSVSLNPPDKIQDSMIQDSGFKCHEGVWLEARPKLVRMDEADDVCTGCIQFMIRSQFHCMCTIMLTSFWQWCAKRTTGLSFNVPAFYTSRHSCGLLFRCLYVIDVYDNDRNVLISYKMSKYALRN